MLATTLPTGRRVILPLAPKRALYLVAAQGRIRVDGQEAGAQEAGTRDEIAVRDETEITVKALEKSKILAGDIRA